MQSWVKLKSSRWKTILPLGILAFVALSALYFIYNVGNNRGYAPKQPIPFSHRKHAGLLKIDCQYCHASVSKSRHATVPSMNVCMNCHKVVKTDSPHIQKMHELVKNGDSFEWIKVHDMPDFVFFNHKRHIAKGVACETCHGNVRSMDRVEQVQKMNMGFCINCHRENKAPITCDTCHR